MKRKTRSIQGDQKKEEYTVYQKHNGSKMRKKRSKLANKILFLKQFQIIIIALQDTRSVSTIQKGFGFSDNRIEKRDK